MSRATCLAALAGIAFTVTVSEPLTFNEGDNFPVRNLPNERQLAQLINRETNWIKGSKCHCNEASLECTCTQSGRRLRNVPVWVLAMSYSMFVEEKFDVQRLHQSNYPIDLRTVHPLLGMVNATDHPFKNIPNRRPFSLDRIGTVFNLTDFRDRDAQVLINYRNISSINSLPAYDQVFFYTHGYQSISLTHANARTQVMAMQRFRRQAIIFVDWQNGATTTISDCITTACNYDISALNTGLIGRELGLMAHLLVVNGKVSPKNVHLIGFSLGAQISHYAANWFSILQLRPANECRLIKVGRLTALDPAAQLFQPFDGSYVSREDANFVDIVHTNSVSSGGGNSDTLAFRFGMSLVVGHVDFFMNNARRQPICGRLPSICSHGRAYKMFEFALNETIEQLPLLASSCECLERFSFCANFESDDVEETTTFGLEDVNSPARGVFYVQWEPETAPTPRFKPEQAVVPFPVIPCLTTFPAAPVVPNDLINFHRSECFAQMR